MTLGKRRFDSRWRLTSQRKPAGKPAAARIGCPTRPGHAAFAGPQVFITVRGPEAQPRHGKIGCVVRWPVRPVPNGATPLRVAGGGGGELSRCAREWRQVD